MAYTIFYKDLITPECLNLKNFFYTMSLSKVGWDGFENRFGVFRSYVRLNDALWIVSQTIILKQV